MDLLAFGQSRQSPGAMREGEAWKRELSEFAGVWGSVGAWVVVLLVLLSIGVWFIDGKLHVALQFFALSGLYTLGVGMIGAFVGFLFGVPLVLAAPAAPADGAPATPAPARHATNRGLRTNTNLERISDWLTAGIVALSLANINNISTVATTIWQYAGSAFNCATTAATAAVAPAAGAAAATALAAATAGCGAAVIAPPTAICLTLIGLLGGFVVGYVTTRVFLDHLFQGVEVRGALLELAAEKAETLDRAALQDIARVTPGVTLAAAVPTSLQALAADPDVQTLAQTPNETVRDHQSPDTAKAVADARVATGDWSGALAMLQIALALLTLFGRGNREKETEEINKRIAFVRPHLPPPPPPGG